MKASRLFLLFFCLPLALPAQDLFGGDRLTSVNNLIVDMIRSQSTKGIQGSPYPHEDFALATVKLASGDTLQHALRYNALLDEMEFEQDGQIYVISNKYRIEQLQLGQKTYWVRPKFMAGQAPGMGFFELLVDGHSRLYVQHLRKFLPEKRPSSGYEQYQPPRIVEDKPVYFIQLDPASAPIAVDAQKKIFLQDFRPHIANIDGLMRKHRIKFNEAGLIDLVTALNISQQ